MAQPSPAVIRLDQPGHAATETELLRFPAPLLDADVAKRCGCDASGLNAAIIVLRHVYWLLQRELTEASQALQQEPEESSEGGSAIRRALIQKAADRRRRALNALHESEARFSLLAAAWLNTPLHAQASMQETIRGCHGEILDAFFRTWKGPDNDLSFAQILDREQARTEVWSDPCFSLVHGRALVYRPDGVWAPTGERGAQDSLVTWKPDAQGSLAALLGSFFRTKVEGGPPSCAVPGYPSVLRIRYVPGERAGSGVNELRNTEIPEMTIQGQLRKGELLIHSFGFGPHPSIYRLFAAVRLRGSPTEHDLIRVFDPHTPLADDVGTPLALVNWQLGAAGHEYDLFYAPPPLEEGARRSEEPMAKGFQLSEAVIRQELVARPAPEPLAHPGHSSTAAPQQVPNPRGTAPLASEGVSNGRERERNRGDGRQLALRPRLQSPPRSHDTDQAEDQRRQYHDLSRPLARADNSRRSAPRRSWSPSQAEDRHSQYRDRSQFPGQGED